jgi:hypothetical protein
MNIDNEYLQSGRPVPDGWHYNQNAYEYQLYEREEVIYTVSEIACLMSKHSPQWLYGVARGIIAP